MKIILDENATTGAVRADRAWGFFCDSNPSLEGSRGLIGFVHWLWDELSEQAGNLNQDASGEVTVALPSLNEDALDFLLRLSSYWATDVRIKKNEAV